jgi:hypothetical protein
MEVTHTNIYSCGPYSIHVGKIKEGDLTHYLVMHTEYEVVEYETDILAAGIAWAQHFAGELEKLKKGEPSDTEGVGQNVLPFTGRFN